MARISYQNSTFRSFYKFDIRLLNWTFVLFASAFVLHKQHSFFKIDIVLHKTAFVCQVLSSTFVLHNLFFKFFVQRSFWRRSFYCFAVHSGI